MAKEQFGFIGTGNMGGALATAVARAVAPNKMVLADRDSDKAAALAQQLGCHTASVIDVAASSKFVVFGCQTASTAETGSHHYTVAKRKQRRRANQHGSRNHNCTNTHLVWRSSGNPHHAQHRRCNWQRCGTICSTSGCHTRRTGCI